MLKLERRAQEGRDTIVIGDREVVIKVLYLTSNKVKLGIIVKNPALSIHREEIFERVGPVLLKLPKKE